jgi:ribulose-5-phosphate 4-epimerase/fuculose-1-phosphate aldolase
MEHEDTFVVQIGGQGREGGSEKEEATDTAKHRDLYAGTNDAACVFPLRGTSAIFGY